MKLSSSPYQEYKVSDNEWCEYIPSTWSEKRVKNIFKLITDLAPNDNDFELLSLYASIGVRPRKDMEQRGNKAITTDGYWIVRKGDIIVNKLLAWMGAIGLSEYDGVTSPAYDILRKSNKEVDAKFYTYLFRTEKAQAIFKKHSRGIMDVRLRLYFDKFGAITVPFPPISEQKAIAHYLDTKTAQIDRKIDLLTQKATLYGNLKQSLINETVTRGLDKSVPMKDSGIEWLGKVPEHWKCGMLNGIARRVVVGIAEAATHAYAEEGTPILRSTNIREGKIIGDIFYINSVFANDRKSKLIKAGDLVTVRTGNVGVTAVVPKELDGCQCFTMLITTLTKLASTSYYCYWMNSVSAQRYFYLTGWGTAQVNISVPILQALPIPIPPFDEQKAIADYLDTKTAQIDQIIQTINTQIEKLKELRKTLINDVVTGKIRVIDNE